MIVGATYTNICVIGWRPRSRAGRRVECAGSAESRSPANEEQLLANWVDVCSEFVCADQLPERWPHTIAVDSQNFRVNSVPNAGRGFHVFAAVVATRPSLGSGHRLAGLAP